MATHPCEVLFPNKLLIGLASVSDVWRFISSFQNLWGTGQYWPMYYCYIAGVLLVRFLNLFKLVYWKMTTQDENTPLLIHKQSINTEDEDTNVTILTPRKLCVICVPGWSTKMTWLSPRLAYRQMMISAMGTCPFTDQNFMNHSSQLYIMYEYLKLQVGNLEDDFVFPLGEAYSMSKSRQLFINLVKNNAGATNV